MMGTISVLISEVVGPKVAITVMVAPFTIRSWLVPYVTTASRLPSLLRSKSVGG